MSTPTRLPDLADGQRWRVEVDVSGGLILRLQHRRLGLWRDQYRRQFPAGATDDPWTTAVRHAYGLLEARRTSAA